MNSIARLEQPQDVLPMYAWLATDPQQHTEWDCETQSMFGLTDDELMNYMDRIYTHLYRIEEEGSQVPDELAMAADLVMGIAENRGMLKERA